ncbi:MAG: YlbF family regulator [Clostridiales bacterium]|nr:YlbF family regulator [Clostridiales bacterium]MDR2712322.1 YlbF family regulator [Clostridiales bacterium]
MLWAKNKTAGPAQTEKGDLWQKVESLAAFLRNTEEYREYSQYREALYLSGYFELVQELRQRQAQVHLARAVGVENRENEDELESLYAYFGAEPVLSNFLYAESRFFTLLQQIRDSFSGCLGLGMEESKNYDRNLN